MVSIVLAGCAAFGTYLLLPRSDPAGHTAISAVPLGVASIHRQLGAWMRRSGLEDVSPLQFVSVSVSVGLGAALLSGAMLGPGVPALVIGAVGCVTPAALWRRRHDAARETARESWPRIIEEVRVLVGSVGRPVPQALIEAGLHAPGELRPAFLTAQREWSLTTDFGRTVKVLKERLADPTADAVCETLLVVHEVGGELDSRLAALAEDRRIALRDHREAAARQAGARFARWFVIVVPAGMAFAGLSLGEGRAAYRTGPGQIATAVAIGLVVLCWWWAGRIMATPDEQRVFDR